MATRPTKYARWGYGGTRVEPTDNKKSTGSLAGEKPPAPYDNWYKDLVDQWIEYFDSVIAVGLLGDGTDGSATLDGVATVSWATLVGSTYTLTREPQLINLTINNGIKLKVNGSSGCYDIFGQGVLDLSLGGEIDGDGAAASGSNPGLGVTGGPLHGGNSGGAGNVNGVTPGGNVGVAGVNATTSHGGAGGAGGNDANGHNGGAGGTVTAPIAALGRRGSRRAGLGYLLGNDGANNFLCSMIQPGGGGGGGACAGGLNAGGGGGASGAYVGIAFAQIKLGTQPITKVHANGGAGAAAGNATAAGGGGGGGGGALDIFSLTSDVTFTTACVAGGAGGAASGAGGANGTAGSAGQVRQVNLSGITGISPPATHANENGVITLTGVESSVTATFNAPFSNTPGNVGGYRYGYTIARTDSVLGVPATLLTVTATDHMTITIIDQFAGTISWFAVPT
jgi:hypothetical protein